MMLLFGIVVLQDPPKPATAVVQRQWKPDQKDRYRVEIDFTDAGGPSSNYFNLDLKAPKHPPQGSEVMVQATYLDQTISFGSLKKTTKGGFGSATLQFLPTGFPKGIVGKGSVAPLMAPLLSWYLPEQVDGEGKFSISGTTDDGVKIEGSGNAVFEKPNEWKVTNQLAFSEKDVALGTLGTTAWFDKKTGRLLRSQGTFKAKDGTAEFRVR